MITDTLLQRYSGEDPKSKYDVAPSAAQSSTVVNCASYSAQVLVKHDQIKCVLQYWKHYYR